MIFCPLFFEMILEEEALLRNSTYAIKRELILVICSYAQFCFSAVIGSLKKKMPVRATQ